MNRLMILLPLVSCVEPTVPGTDSEPSTVPTDTDTPSETGVPTGDTGDPWTLPAGPGFAGRLVDGDGAPIAAEELLACTTTSCLTVDSDAQGRFWFPLDEVPEIRSVKTHDDPDGVPPRGAALVYVECVDATAVDLGDIVVPALAAGATWGAESADPQTLEVGDGLVLTASRAAVHLAFGQSFTDPVAAGRLPDAWIPAYPGFEEEVLAVYALTPFDATSDAPIGLSAPSDLPAGTAVHFWSVGSLGQGLSGPATGTADGARVTTDPGQGLYELTHVVISR